MIIKMHVLEGALNQISVGLCACYIVPGMFLNLWSLLDELSIMKIGTPVRKSGSNLYYAL